MVSSRPAFATIKSMMDFLTRPLCMAALLLCATAGSEKESCTGSEESKLKAKQCACTYRDDLSLKTIKCVAASGDSSSGVIFDQLSPAVEEVTFTHYQWAELPSGLQKGHSESKYRCLAKNKTFAKLTHLNLTNNHINIIGDHAFECFPNLKTLVLDNNNWLADGLAHNNVMYNSTALGDLPQLRELYLRNAFTQQAFVYKQNYKPSSKSEYKNLSVTNFFPNPDTIFRGKHLPKLELVDMSSGHTLGFSPDAFCNLTALKTLNLSSNALGRPLIYGNERKGEVHGNCTASLETLDLSDNLMIKLAGNFLAELAYMTKLKSLSIARNPFLCDCDMKGFHAWLLNESLSQHVINRESLTCSDPELLRDKKLMDLEPGDLVCISPQNSDSYLKVTYAVLSVVLAVIVVVLIAYLYLNRELIKRNCVRVLFPLKSQVGRQPYPYSSVQI